MDHAQSNDCVEFIVLKPQAGGTPVSTLTRKPVFHPGDFNETIDHIQ
jgi:hypothetical protein